MSNQRLIFKTATIANGAALSDEIDLYDGVNDAKTLTVVGLVMPSSWTTANVGFQVSTQTGGTYQPVADTANALIEVDSATASRSYVLNPTITLSFPFLKVWSQTGGSDTNQGAERQIVLICRDFA